MYGFTFALGLMLGAGLFKFASERASDARVQSFELSCDPTGSPKVTATRTVNGSVETIVYYSKHGHFFVTTDRPYSMTEAGMAHLSERVGTFWEVRGLAARLA